MFSAFKQSLPSPWIQQSRFDESWRLFCRRQVGRLVRDHESSFRFEDLKRHWSDFGPLIRRALVSGSFEVRPGRAVTAQLDKERTLIQFPWVERFVYFHVASCLFEDFEPQWSPRLWSFRPGLGQSLALKSVSQHLHQTRDVVRWVLRRDVRSYGESMVPEILLQTIDQRRPLHPWERHLLEKLFAYPFLNAKGDITVSTRGLPTGSFLQVVCENIYLMPLDELLSSINGLYWARFGDDILAIGDPKTLMDKRLPQQLDECITQLGLSWKTEKSQDTVVSPSGAPLPQIRGSQSFDYLGRQVFYNGDLYLNADKRRAFLQELDRLLSCVMSHRHGPEPEHERLKWITTALHQAWSDPRGLMFRSLSSITHDISDEGLAELDRLVTERVMSAIAGGRFRRGNYRKLKGHSLRQRGLPSLVHWKRKKLLEVS